MEQELWSGRSELQELWPAIFITNFFGARSREKLNAAGITHVCVCAQELETPFEGQGVTYLKLKLADNPGQDLVVPGFGPAFAFIDEALRSDKTNRVLLHCAGGGSRSAAIGIGYLLHKGFFPTVQAAITHAQSVRPIVNPNFGFLEQLRTLEGGEIAIAHPPPPADSDSR